MTLSLRDVVVLAVVDLGVVVGASWVVSRLLRSELRQPSRANSLLAGVAAGLFLCALPFAWADVNVARVEIEGFTTATATSPMAFAAVLLAAVALGLAAARQWTPRQARAGAIVRVILGGTWVIVALDSLIVAAGVSRELGEGVSITAGVALWLCLTGGLLAVASGAAGAAWSRPSQEVVRTAPPSGNVDEWGVTRTPIGHETGDEW